MEGMVRDAENSGPGGARRGPAPLKVLVTGADGYIGAILCPTLMEAGHDVTGLDTGFYRSAWLYDDGRDHPRTITHDTRRLRPDLLKGFDAVVHLAELSNDPLCAFDEALTWDINHVGSVAIAKAAKEAGVGRFVYASSCSVYGAGGDAPVSEEDTPHPQTAYARCKLAVERDVSEMANDSFCPTFLRFATAFGASPRMRFDIVLNNLAGMAWTTRRIKMTSDGQPWRPLVHVQDIAQAITAVLGAPRDAVFKERLNVGDDRNNYRIREITEMVADVVPTDGVELGQNNGDNRSYQVSFGKIRKHLPGFQCRWDAERGAKELRDIFERTGMTKETFDAAPYTRLSELRHLFETHQVDEKLYWRTHALS